jgi:hypothetical protein
MHTHFFQGKIIMPSVKAVVLLISIILTVYSQENCQSKYLDDMYNDIIQSIPKAQRQLVDSAFKNPKDKTTTNTPHNNQYDSSVNNESKTFSNEQNEKLKNMIEQANINREKRIIHFMSTEQETETK